MAATSELRAIVDLLVRPGPIDLMPGTARDDSTGRIAKDAATSPERLRDLVDRVTPGDLPLLVSVNQEGGRLNALDWPGTVQLPGALALGAADDSALAEAAGAAVAGQLRAVGLAWNLAPVCDLASWPSTSAVGTRAFGADPVRVAELVSAFVRGLQGAGVAGTAKHFPGLGGVTADPHESAPVVRDLPSGALLPFRAAVDAGVACVMAGSHTIRSLDDRPAFASRRVLGLLRDELGFDGVVVSENLSLPAVHTRFGGVAEAAVAAVAAGVDIVMFDSEVSRGGPNRTGSVPHRRAAIIDALILAVEAGRIDRERVEHAAGRVRRFHQLYGVCPGTGLPDWESANVAAHTVAARISRSAVTVLRGQHLLPAPLLGAPVALVSVPDTEERRADSARHAPDLVPAVFAERVPVRPVPAGGDVVGCSMVVVHSYHSRRLGSEPSAAALEAARLAGAGIPVVQIAFGDLDDLAGSPADILMAAFAPHQECVTAVADILLRDGAGGGRLPVDAGPW